MKKIAFRLRQINGPSLRMHLRSPLDPATESRDREDLIKYFTDLSIEHEADITGLCMHKPVAVKSTLEVLNDSLEIPQESYALIWQILEDAGF